MKYNNYKTNIVKKVIGMMAVAGLSAVLLTGCGQSDEDTKKAGDTAAGSDHVVGDNTDIGNAREEDSSENLTGTEDVRVENPSGRDQAAKSGSTQLEVRFGDNGEAFMMTLLDNETAAAIAGYVGTSDWRLPIYERNDDADYSVLQYYDIPSRYEIPSAPVTVTEAKAGDVFYSDPNRIVLFYHDAEISSEYTIIGTFDATEEFITAVEENPVLEGWGNKIILISEP